MHLEKHLNIDFETNIRGGLSSDLSELPVVGPLCSKGQAVRSDYSISHA